MCENKCSLCSRLGTVSYKSTKAGGASTSCEIQDSGQNRLSFFANCSLSWVLTDSVVEWKNMAALTSLIVLQNIKLE